MRNRRRVGWHRYINGVTISTAVTTLFILVPLYWLVATSFKNPNAIGNTPPTLAPSPFSTENYHNAFVNYDFGIYFKTSIIVTLAPRRSCCSWARWPAMPWAGCRCGASSPRW